jgi:hypothetical protein
MGRRKRKPSGDLVDGILLLDKPEGITSNDALQQARQLLGHRKQGTRAVSILSRRACSRCVSAQRPAGPAIS